MSETQRLQCRAHSKQSGERCRRFARIGKTLCNSHGGKTESVSCLANVTHGLRRQFLPVEDVEAIAAKAAELTSTDGVKAMLRASAARIDLQSERITDPEHLPALLAARHSVRSDLSLLHTIATDEAAPAPTPTIVVSNYAEPTPTACRTLDGIGTMFAIGGAPFLLDQATGAYWPAVKLVDEETGAEYYERVDATH